MAEGAKVWQGTLAMTVLKCLEAPGRQHGYGIARRIEQNRRKANFYRITKAGRKQLESDARQWQQATGIIARFFALKGEAQ